MEGEGGGWGTTKTKQTKASQKTTALETQHRTKRLYLQSFCFCANETCEMKNGDSNQINASTASILNERAVAIEFRRFSSGSWLSVHLLSSRSLLRQRRTQGFPRHPRL